MGGRHGDERSPGQLQYEMFYSAAQHVSDARVYDAWDWEGSLAMVDDALGRIGQPA